MLPLAPVHWLLALALVGCGSNSSPLGAEPQEVEPASSEAVASATWACSEARCAASAGPCQVAACDDSSGLCRSSPAREGEACLPGNPCGSARCRSGQCEPEAPPECLELVDDCQAAVCDPRQGCVAHPRDVAGARCEQPTSLETHGFSSASTSNACGQPTRALPGCLESLAGPSAYFELDLRAASEPVPVILIIDAGFELEAALTRGPCADPVLEQCATPYYVDGRTRAIAATLAPDRYRLIVNGVNASDRGLVHVAASVGDPTCSAVPSNDSCGAARPLDTSLGQQSVLGNTACATPDVPLRCAAAAAPDVFYELDLSGRTAETLLEIELDQGVASLFARVPGAAPAPGACGELLSCGEGFSRKLPPGVYTLGVSRAADASSQWFSLRASLGTPDCDLTTNTSWQTATELDPTLEQQRIQGNTACGTNQFASACNDDRGAPELYYRLDLRARTAPTNVTLSGRNGASGLIPYLLQPPSGETDASPWAVTACSLRRSAFPWLRHSAYLAPRLYYLVIDGWVQSQGRFELEVSLSDAYEVPVPCLDGSFWFGLCLRDTEPECAESRSSPRCRAAAVECGLSPQLYADYCAELPGCCEASTDPELCSAAWERVAGCK